MSDDNPSSFETGDLSVDPFLALQREKDPYDLRNMSVLIVEDSGYLKSLMISMLKLFGVGDIMSCDGAEEAKDLLTIALAKSTSRHITGVDIILTDWLMPKGSGEELVHWVRTHKKPEMHYLPIVVVSAYTTEHVAMKARDMGVNETMAKPVSGKGLAQRICSVIDAPRPFLRTQDYFGPDRRRKDMPYKGADRRSQDTEHMAMRSSGIDVPGGAA